MKMLSGFACALAAAGLAMLSAASAGAAALLVRYDFENASGSSVPDSSGNNFNGTFAGSGAVSNDAAVGAKSGQMPFLDMPNSTTTPAFTLPTDQMTIDTWVKLPLVGTALPNNI